MTCATCERNLREREAELPLALRIVDEETDRFVGDWNFREVAPVIRQLQESWERPKQEELHRLINKLPDLDERAREEIRRSFDRLTNKMLHRPVESLRHDAAHGVPIALRDSLSTAVSLQPLIRPGEGRPFWSEVAAAGQSACCPPLIALDTRGDT